MRTRTCHGYSIAALVGALLYATGGYHSVGHADVTSSGLGTVVNQPATGVFDVTGGTRPSDGANLFHSFGNFSLATPESANFLNDSGLATSNIVARVTGGNPSSIFGTIDTTDFGGANLFLMNSAGIMFGPTAQLNVGGSFHATTADYIKLGNDGGIFYADPAQASALSVAPPSAFGFLAANPAGIDVNTSNAFIGGPGQTLSFVGGPLNVGAADGSAPGYVFAPGGRVNLVSVGSPGEATFDGTGFNVDGVAELGDINIRGGSIVDGKDVYVRGGQLTIDEGIILPNISFYLLGGPAPDGGEVNIEVTGNVSITGTDVDPLTETPPGIFVFSGDFFDVPTVAGKVPDVRIKADSVSISGFSGIQSDRMGPGLAGDITIDANTLSVAGGGSIVAFNTWEGPGGDIIINAKDVDVSGDGSPTATGFSGIGSQGLFHPAYGTSVDAALTNADSGNIVLNLTGNLKVSGLGQIVTDSLNLGNAGNITITAGDVVLAGTGTGLADDGLIGTQTVFTGASGDVTINASGTIDMSGGFRVSSSTFGSGEAGEVNLTAGQSITLSGENTRILGRTTQPPDSTLDSAFGYWTGEDYATLKGLTTELLGIPDPTMFDVLLLLRELGFLQLTDEQLLAGDGGRISINAPVLTLNADTSIQTSTGWDGNAGSMEAKLGSLSLNDGGFILSTSGIETVERDGTLIGPAVGSGNGGSVDLTATDTISISGRSPTTGTGSSVSTTTFGDGNGGPITITGNRIQVSNGGIVSADSGGTLAGESLSGTGLAGDITINAGKEINLSDGTISTRAVTADGGNIAMMAPEQVYLLDSEITTSVESGFGGGGNINIDPDFVILNQSNILANAYGGPGGNINIVAGNFIISAESSVDASSALGLDGTVNISSPDAEVAEELAVLPANYLDVTSLMSERCGTTTGASSLVDAGPGGLAVDPDGYLPSFATETNQENEAKGRSRSVSGGKRWWALDAGQPALQLAQMTCTR